MKLKTILIGLAAIAVVAYGGYLIKKSYINKGYESKDDAKEVLLSYYVISLGLPDTKQNRDKYRSMTLEQLKKRVEVRRYSSRVS
jgi:hypothetical protein